MPGQQSQNGFMLTYNQYELVLAYYDREEREKALNKTAKLDGNCVVIAIQIFALKAGGDRKIERPIWRLVLRSGKKKALTEATN